MSTDPDLRPTAAVDPRCARASGTQGILAYGAGTCDTYGNPDGISAAAFGRYLIAEGVFIGGKFVPGGKYRTLNRSKFGASSDEITSCSDMRPSSYDYPGGPRPTDFEFRSSKSTVCKVWLDLPGGTYLHKVFDGEAGSILVGTMGRMEIVGNVQQQAYYTDSVPLSRAKQTVEVIGAAGPASGGNRYNLPAWAARSGTIRRLFHSDVYAETVSGKSRQYCLESASPQSCVHVDDCTLNPSMSTARMYEPRHGCQRSGPQQPILFDDGAIFTPGTPQGLAVFFSGARVAPPNGAKTYRLGDALVLVPIEGTLKSREGREYSGRFVNGTPQ